jgi:hypothetical protein
LAGAVSFRLPNIIFRQRGFTNLSKGVFYGKVFISGFMFVLRRGVRAL